jgi:hypothetical protein
MSPELAFQTVVYERVTAALPSVPNGTTPPGNQVLPYVQFGNTDTEDHEIGHDITIYVHHWAGGRSPHIVKENMHAVRNELHGTIYTNNGWRFSCIRETFADVLLDEDEQTWHGIQRFRALASLE